jgi:hypothetical protein
MSAEDIDRAFVGAMLFILTGQSIGWPWWWVLVPFAYAWLHGYYKEKAKKEKEKVADK